MRWPQSIGPNIWNELSMLCYSHKIGVHGSDDPNRGQGEAVEKQIKG